MPLPLLPLLPLFLLLLPITPLPLAIHPYDTTPIHPQNLIQYPVVFRSQRVGIVRLIHIPQKLSSFPKVTFTTWLYLRKYCKEPGNERCTILNRANDKGQAQSPTLYLTDEGRLVFFVQLISGPADLVISGFTLPLNQWISIQLNVYKLQMQITVRDRNAVEIGTMFYTYDHMVDLNYVNTDWNMGGNLWHISVDGVVGMTDIYVNQHVDPGKISWPTISHPTFKIGNGTTTTCNMMRYNLYELLGSKKPYIPSDKYELNFPNEEDYREFEETALKVGEQLLKQAYPLLDGGRVIEGYKLLAQAECYGSINATFTKTVLEAPDHPPNGKEFLTGSLRGDVLSDLALAFRHRHDTPSEIPLDCESALVYYERLALEAHETMNNATLHNVWAETVKLSSEKELFDQEGEKGEQHRKNVELAVEGDIEAAKRLGAQHLVGSHGRAKDLDKAYSYYKRAADQGDLHAIHETALMKISGHGTKQDKKGGVEMLIRAAEAGFVSSLAGLGWFHSEHSGNLTEALKYYKQGAAAGDIKSMYALGMVYSRSDCPGGPDYKKAITNFEAAAAQGHIAAALESGTLHKFGLGTPRSCSNAVRFYHWIAVKHDKLARLTRQALEHYFQKEYQKAFVRYQLAGEAGCETSQYNAAYLTEKENSKTFHPSSSATLYYYSLSALQDNHQAELALKLYNMNLALVNKEVQEHVGSKHKIRTVQQASVQFKGHVHEIITAQDDYNISVEYSSAERMAVGVELVSVDPTDGTKTLKVWSQKLIISSKNSYKTRARIRLLVPKALQQLPDRQYNILGQTVQLRCWIAHIDIWANNEREVFEYARDRNSIEIIGPWTSVRKFEELTMCQSFTAWILALQEPKFPQCPTKQDWTNKGYPFIMDGKKCGIAIKDDDYVSQEEGVVTLSLWFMLTNKCSADLCSLVYRFDDSGSLYSPLITIDRRNKLHITVFFGKDGRIGTIDEPVPFAKWVHLAVSIKGALLVGCTSTGKTSVDPKCQYWRFNDPIVYNENDGLWLMGGNFYLPGPTGYFGSLRLYRDQFHDANRLMSAVSELPQGIWDTGTRKGYNKCRKTFT